MYFDDSQSGAQLGSLAKVQNDVGLYCSSQLGQQYTRHHIRTALLETRSFLTSYSTASKCLECDGCGEKAKDGQYYLYVVPTSDSFF